VAAGRALVTGATGCLGGYLVEALVERGTPVRALVRATSRTAQLERLGVDLQRGELTDEDALAGAVAGVDTVFHLGGVVLDDASERSEEAWAELRRVNVDGTETLARLAAAAGVCRFVFASSARVFGFGNQLLWPEDGERTPSDLYARGKVLAEEALLRVGAETGLEVVNLRPRFIYGRDDRYVLPKLVAAALRGRAPVVRSGGICDIVYARDCAEALVLASAASVAGQSYNITSGECLTMREIIAEVAGALRRRVRFVPLPAPVMLGAAAGVELGARALRRKPPVSRAQVRWLLNDHHFSIAKARRELGYEPRYRLPRALQEIDLRQFIPAGG
jgi:3beta-hydroxy-delta5-steroid dehydrogenase/steroid delta-isomerase